MGICLFFAGVFTFSGCSLVSGSSEKKGEAVVMKIGDTNVTRNDLINSFYTYYQNNSSYFAYYDIFLVILIYLTLGFYIECIYKIPLDKYNILGNYLILLVID